MQTADIAISQGNVGVSGFERLI